MSIKSDNDFCPLSDNQFDIFIKSLNDENSIKYNIPVLIRFDKNIDLLKLKNAILKNIEFHPYLKTEIVKSNNGLIQKKYDDIESIEIINVNKIDDKIIHDEIKPFKLLKSQLFKIKLFKSSFETVLFMDFHKVICNEQDVLMFLDDLSKIYDGKKISIKSYSDMQNSESWGDIENYFKEKFELFDESTTIFPDSMNDSSDTEKTVKSISKNLITSFCQKHNIDESVLFLTSVMLNLNKFTFSDKILINGAYYGGKNHDCQKPLLLAHDMSDRDESINDLILNVAEMWNESLNHSNYSIYDFYEEYGFNRGFFFEYTRNNLTFSLEDNDYNIKFLKDSHSDCDVNLNVLKSDDRFVLTLYYDTSLYSTKYMNLFLNSLETVIYLIITKDIDDLKISDIELKKDHTHFNFMENEFSLLNRKFENQVLKTPDNIALIAEDGKFTYDDLNRKANRIANSLIELGVNPGDNILFMLPRNSNLIACVLGILKAGCGFVPIDLDYPKERIRYIMQDSGADYIIIDNDFSDTLNIHALLDNEDDANPNPDISPENTAYMIYTSGSTGNPKGVMISHANITNLFEKSDNNLIHKIYSNMKRVLGLTTVSFDAFLLDFMTLTYGSTLIFASSSESKDINLCINLIKRTNPDSIAIITPSRLSQFMSSDEFCKQLGEFNSISCGGEKLSQNILDKIRENCNVKLYNLYGPTEATIASNGKLIEDEITVGKSLHNYITEVRDIDSKLLPDGVMGELYIGGLGVGKGYWNNIDKTEEVFKNINDIAYYKTGDYAVSHDGEIDIKGRIDSQIKLRGLRIEIEEIEKVISSFAGIDKCVVVIDKISSTDHLCAYYTVSGSVDIKELKKYLKDRLTYYMVPTVFMEIEEFSQTPNGKIDYKKLPEPQIMLSNVGSENDTEREIYNIVSEMVEFDDFGVTDDLYTLGFTSLTLMNLNSMIYEKMKVMLDITLILAKPTIRDIAGEVQKSNNQIRNLTDRKYYPLNENQLGVYFECVQTPGELKYNIPAIIEFDNNIDVDRLVDSIYKTVDAHPYLKTHIVMHNGQLQQKRRDSAEIDDIEIVNCEDISADEIEKDLVPFHLLNNQLFRFKIYKTKDKLFLLSDFHHIITDGVSINILLNDLANVYQKKPVSKEIIDGYMYSLIEKESEKSEKFTDSKKYFEEKLNGIESTILTPDLNGDAADGKLKSINKNIDVSILKEFCRECGISPNVLFMSVAMLNLNKFTFDDESLITTIFNGRINPDYQNTQVMLVKTLPIIHKASDRSITLRQYLKDVDRTWKETLTKISYPYTKLSSDFDLKPEFFYTYHDNIKTKNVEIDSRIYDVTVFESYSAKYKFCLDIYEDNGTADIRIRYNDKLYTEKYAKMFLDNIEFILTQFISSDIDEVKISDVRLNTGVYNVPVLEKTDEIYVIPEFENQVLKTPDDIALIAEDGEFTYGELNRKANRIANSLIKKGIKSGSNVLVMLNRDSNQIASILAVLKTGSTVIPLDIDFPKDRVNYVYENSKASYILNDVNELLGENNDSNPNIRVSGDDLAYIIYTSGSTGKPKGVMITHRNVANFFEKNEDNLIYEMYHDRKRVLAITTVAFDVFWLELMGLTHGSTLILANNNETKDVNLLSKLIKKTKPDSLSVITPSRLIQYLQFDEFARQLSDFNFICCAGEKLPYNLVEKIRNLSEADVYNLYGPTETTIASNVKLIDDWITVGKALKNYITEVRDIDGQLLPKGVMGELYIGGYGVSNGYYNDPQKTEGVFIKINGIDYYRSGDYAIELDNGEIDIKNRIDNQIKLRGLRIEIDEVRNVIAKFFNMDNVVVVIRKINNVEHLCAYFKAATKINISNLKYYLKNRLTSYMVPTAFMQVDDFKYTPNGKIDLKALPEIDLKNEFVAPENKLEQFIASIFSGILEIDEVGALDNFFEIGGTSLSASGLIMELIKRDFQVQYSDIFSNPTPRQLAKFITEGDRENDFNSELIKNYDYENVNELLLQNTLQNYFEGKKQDLGNVLLLGANGFLGMHILNEYLNSEDGKLYCMMRKGDFESCEKRLDDLIEYYGFDVETSRINIIEGDITSPDDFSKLESLDIDTVINCAAIVKHYSADDYIFKVNVDGVRNTLRFVQNQNIRFIQISTRSIAEVPGDEKLPLNFIFDEKMFYFGQDLSNKYLNSKFLAERLVFEKMTEGLNAKVIRVGNLMGRDSDGVFQKNYKTNAFVNNLKAFSNLGVVSYDLYSSPVEISPVDITAKAVLNLSKTPKECCAFNCQNNNMSYLGDLLKKLSVRPTSNTEFKYILNENMDDNVRGLITSGIFESGEDASHIRISSDYTSTILHDMGLLWPHCDGEYISRFIGELKRLDFFDE